jgi:hypothetical protein
MPRRKQSRAGMAAAKPYANLPQSEGAVIVAEHRDRLQLVNGDNYARLRASPLIRRKCLTRLAP